jgi:hypothetical protein
MILTENAEFLKKNYPALWNYLEPITTLSFTSDTPSIRLVNTKNGALNLIWEREDQAYSLHSQYNPEAEAERFVANLGNIADYKHVLFFGTGLGYHIFEFMNKYPDTSFSIFEPEAAVFSKLLEFKSINKLSFNRLLHISIGMESLNKFISDFVFHLVEHVLIVIPPSIERAYKNEANEFYTKFQKAVEGSKTSLATNLGFEELWTVNSLKNFAKVSSTVNIVRDKRAFFADKPVIIAAAGPSLSEEYEQLRYIKEKGLAYIFAVGSANKGLIANGIVPDAMTTYDPLPVNYNVFKEVIESGTDNIPLIFGSSVGFETVEKYPGPLLHMITSQDSVAPYFLYSDTVLKQADVIFDAPSIAVVTLQLLAKLGANPIILVGQNFSFKKDMYYAEGIRYSTRPQQLNESEKASFVEVEEVEGGKVLTSKGHISSRLQMEAMISLIPSQVINTTKGGAKIAGTQFMELSEIISNDFGETRVVDPAWYMGEPTSYDFTHMKQQIVKVNASKEQFTEILERIFKMLKKINQLSSHREINKLSSLFVRFDGLMNTILNNEYFQVFIQPMIRVQFEILGKSTKLISNETDVLKKATLVIEKFGKFIYECKAAEVKCELLYQSIVTTTLPAAAGN